MSTDQKQQDYLRAIKDELGVTWDELAEMAGIAPRALKTYRMPETSGDHRPMPSVVRTALDSLTQSRARRSRKSQT